MPGKTYAGAGVNVKKVRAMQAGLGEILRVTFRTRAGKLGNPIRPIGLYAGLIDLGDGDALALHTDGVGTKVLVAQEIRKFDTVGIDCVAMTVNDLICVGAEPISLIDYLALEREDDALVEELAKGLVKGAEQAEVAIVGGETAIMGDLIKGVGGKAFDLVSMGVGLVKKDSILDGSAISEGDTILGVASSGLHSNGYTLARKALAGHDLKESIPELGRTLGQALLEPTSIYVKPALEALRKSDVHGIAHITGGGLSKLNRLAGDRKILFDLVLPPLQPIFSYLMAEGGIAEREMYRTFNMGLGLCICVPPAESRSVARIFGNQGFSTSSVGTVSKGSGVRVNGLKIA